MWIFIKCLTKTKNVFNSYFCVLTVIKCLFFLYKICIIFLKHFPKKIIGDSNFFRISLWQIQIWIFIEIKQKYLNMDNFCAQKIWEFETNIFIKCHMKVSRISLTINFSANNNKLLVFFLNISIIFLKQFPKKWGFAILWISLL